MNTEKALQLIERERERQVTLKNQGRFRYTCADAELSDAEKLTILVEEVGEVARQVLCQPYRPLVMNDEGSREELKKEVIQIAAIAVNWIRSLG
jgi:NTP pyrophosphatase (non-canonical NTP hydrolase)